MTIVPTILCVGTVALDLILVSQQVPDKNERVEATEACLSGGGNAANAAVAIARLGLPVEFCGTVGDDRAGDLVVEELAAEGVGVGLVERRAGVTTAQSAVLVSSETGERAIVTHPAPRPPPIPAGFGIVHLDKAGWNAVPVDGIRDAMLSVDDGNIIPGLDLSLLTWYVPTAAVLRSRFGTADAVEGARRAQINGAECVIATEGATGSFGLDRGGSLHFSPSLPVHARSTLGAGDVFHGALIAAFAMGHTMGEALRFASVAAALSCRDLDGRSAAPRLAEVEQALFRLDQTLLSEVEIIHLFSRPADSKQADH